MEVRIQQERTGMIGGMRIRWLGQSGYLLQDEETAVIIDPYLSDRVSRTAGRPRLPKIPLCPGELPAGTVICTHNHGDHLDPDTIAAMDLSSHKFLAPSDCAQALTELGVKNRSAFDEGTVAQDGKFTLEAVFARHTVPAVGVLVTYEGVRLWFSGDTRYDGRLEEMKRRGPDVIFLCINGRLGNMSVEEAAGLARRLEPAVAVPAHYGMFASNTEDPEKFTSRVKNSFEMKFNREYYLSELLDRRGSR